MAHDEVSWSAKDSVISQDRTEDLEGRVHLLKFQKLSQKSFQQKDMDIISTDNHMSPIVYLAFFWKKNL